MKGCPNCGEISDDKEVYCPRCGTRLYDIVDSEFAEGKKEKPKMSSTIFGRIGFGLSVGGVGLCWLGFPGLFCAVAGLVFSSVSKTQRGEKGKTFAVLGMIFSTLFMIAYIILFIFGIIYSVREAQNNV